MSELKKKFKQAMGERFEVNRNNQDRHELMEDTPDYIFYPNALDIREFTINTLISQLNKQAKAAREDYSNAETIYKIIRDNPQDAIDAIVEMLEGEFSPTEGDNK